MIEDSLPDRFKRLAYHPSAFIYAWKKSVLEKFFQELMKSNIAVLQGEVWVVDKGVILKTIPLRTGKIDLFEWKNTQKKGEDWYDFVERSCKETLELINGWNLERNAHPNVQSKILYHFDFAQDPS